MVLLGQVAFIVLFDDGNKSVTLMPSWFWLITRFWRCWLVKMGHNEECVNDTMCIIMVIASFTLPYITHYGSSSDQ